MSDELALKLIAENKAKHARGEDARVLDLGNCGLEEVPEEVKEMIWLEELILSNEWHEPNFEGLKAIKRISQNSGTPNRIQSITNLNKLTQLRRLIVADKLIWGTSDWELYDLFPLSSLINLQYLDCSSTKVSDISPLSGLINLQYLDCSSTKVSDISPLSSLINLQGLICSYTQVSTLTPLSGLRNLKLLSFSRTFVSNLAPLSGLVDLLLLDFDWTKVTDISPLSKLYRLQVLDCQRNHISDLLPLARLNNLRQIICSQTQISSIEAILPLIRNGIPVKLKELPNNDGIYIGDCPLTNPPIEIVQKGNSAILQYFEELDLAKKTGTLIRLAEAKCLILGEGGVGKTSLTRKLLNPNNPLPGEEETTKGINIHPLDWKSPDGTDFRLNIWDFGGQEIYHATHQFFLTKRSLYILLDDTRKDEKSVNDPTFNYWLQVAELYGGGSPLLIVQNEKGDRSKELDLRGMQGRFSFVKDAKSTNLLTCRGLDKVWEAIEFYLKQLPHIGEEQPKAWLDIRRELERLAQKEKRDHISLEEYYSICTQHKIPERERALFLSGYLHDFGTFLHFQDHPLLRKTLVLNNQWATDAVYKVLDCEEVKRTYGRFTRHDLSTIWAGDRYADQHDELLALMEKFEICYKLPDEKAETWLAPQLLSVVQPDALFWDETDNLQVRYEYEFMPKGLLSQHIVRMHRYVKQPDLAWKSGVLFEREGSTSLVTEVWGSRTIRIHARGTHAKELLTLLAEDFDKMHDRLGGLKVKKMIPCNCRMCDKVADPHFYDYEKLTRRRTDGKLTVECDVSYENVSVVGLLDGVFTKKGLDPRHLLESGQIEEGLRQLPSSNETRLLLSQFNNAEKEFQFGRIKHYEFEAVQNRVVAAALKLLQSRAIND